MNRIKNGGLKWANLFGFGPDVKPGEKIATLGMITLVIFVIILAGVHLARPEVGSQQERLRRAEADRTAALDEMKWVVAQVKYGYDARAKTCIMYTKVRYDGHDQPAVSPIVCTPEVLALIPR